MNEQVTLPSEISGLSDTGYEYAEVRGCVFIENMKMWARM